jgi:hypothetical protein
MLGNIARLHVWRLVAADGMDDTQRLEIIEVLMFR